MIFTINNLLSINHLSKKIIFYTFIESIKNQIQIIKINDISLHSPIYTIFVFGKIYCIIIIIVTFVFILQVVSSCVLSF